MESTKEKFLEWEDIDKLKRSGEELNPIDSFLHSNEPAGEKCVLFRGQLSAAVNFEDEEYRVTRNVEIVGMFMEHCKEEGFIIPEELFDSFFNV